MSSRIPMTTHTGRWSLRIRTKRWFGDYKWPLIGFMWVVALVLGYAGFSKYFSGIADSRSPLDTFYHTLQLFTLASGSLSGSLPLELQVARFLAPAMAVYTALQALAAIIQDQLQRLRLRFMRNHVVVCGLGRKGLLLCEGFRANGDQVVVIEQDEGNDMLRQCRELGTSILMGNAADPGLLRMAHVHRAKYVISVCGNDGVNAEVAVRTRELASRYKGTTLTCIVHIFDLRLCTLLKELEMRMGKLDPFRLEFFNVYESGARILLDEYDPFAPHERGDHSRRSIAVVGVGRMGESLIVNAARRWGDRMNEGDERLRITMVDGNAEQKRRSLQLRYPQLGNVCDLVCCELDIKGPEYEEGGFLFNGHGHSSVTMLYICLDGDSSALAAALTLYQRVRAFQIPIVVRMTHDAGLASLLQGETDEREGFVDVHPFGLLDRTCRPDLVFAGTYDLLARAIHEDYVQQEMARGISVLNNPALVEWKALPEDLKESNRSQAEHIRIKLQAVGCDIRITTDWDPPLFAFTPEEVELMAEMEHERFVEERLRQGFRPGATKDFNKKTSPTLVPWDDLSKEERQKDRNAVIGLPAFLARARFQIYRLGKAG